jgi:thiamine-phosphate pyrophosphorylase
MSRRRLASAAARLNAAHRMAGLLPPLVLFTDDERLAEPLAAARALPKGSMVVVRARAAARREVLARALLALARRRDLFVLVADDAPLAARLGADGLHLPERRACDAAHWRALYPHWIITAALHAGGAAPGGLDAVFLSPVFPTRSHPGGAALSAVRANALARALKVPAYALGGVDAGNAALLHGFVGIAAIGALA